MDRDPREVSGRLWHVAGCFPTKQRDVALLEPRNHRIVEARRSLVDWPRSQFRPPRPTTPTNKESITGSGPDARFLFPSLEILRKDSRSRLQVRDAFEPWNVVEDPACADAVLHRQDGIPGGSAFHRHEFRHRIAVPHFAVEESMGE